MASRLPKILSDFLISRGIAVKKLYRQQKRPEPFLTPGENGDDNIVPLFSCLIQRRLSPNIRRNQKGSLNHDH